VLQYVPGNRKIKTGGFITAITSSIQNWFNLVKDNLY
jgi:hypothetical protein